MSEDGKYNGWANYVTWRVNLEFCDDITSGLVGEETFEDVASLAGYLQNAVEEWVDESISMDNSTRESILIGWVNAFLEDVDWYEIAEANAEELVELADMVDDGAE